jgi:hypothetical protein
MKKKIVKRGRPKKARVVVENTTKRDEPFIDEAEDSEIVEDPQLISQVGLCACGEPLAEGQTYVCKKHIKAN